MMSAHSRPLLASCSITYDFFNASTFWGLADWRDCPSQGEQFPRNSKQVAFEECSVHMQTKSEAITPNVTFMLVYKYSFQVNNPLTQSAQGQYQTTGDSPCTTENIENHSNWLNLFILASSIPSQENHSKVLANNFPPFPLPPDIPWCFFVWPVYAPFSCNL